MFSPPVAGQTHDVAISEGLAEGKLYLPRERRARVQWPRRLGSRVRRQPNVSYRYRPVLGCKVMIEFHLSVDALGKTRFAYSPLAEVASSLRLFGEGRHAYVMMPWLRDVRRPLQRLDFDLL